MYMYICIYTCVYIYTYICIYTHIYILYMHSDSGNDKGSGDIADATSGRPLVNHSRMQEAETTHATSGQPLTHASSIRPSNLVDSRLYIQQQKTLHVAVVVVVVMVAIAIVVVIVIAQSRVSRLHTSIKRKMHKNRVAI